jgi:hypothetical protein
VSFWSASLSLLDRGGTGAKTKISVGIPVVRPEENSPISIVSLSPDYGTVTIMKKETCSSGTNSTRPSNWRETRETSHTSTFVTSTTARGVILGSLDKP